MRSHPRLGRVSRALARVVRVARAKTMAKRRRDRTSVELTSTAGAASASAARARTTRLPRAVDLFVARGRAVTEKAHEVEAMTRAIVPQLQGQVWTRFFRERGRGVARAAREGDGRGRQRERALVILKAEVHM
jgi:hypothetical protein